VFTTNKSTDIQSSALDPFPTLHFNSDLTSMSCCQWRVWERLQWTDERK